VENEVTAEVEQTGVLCTEVEAETNAGSGFWFAWMPTGFELIWGLGIVFLEGEEEIN
jgi:hypothetical protein